MAPLRKARQSVTSGVEQLDRLLDGLYIGDNVVWYDHAGILATVFCLNFLRSSEALKKPVIYVSFDRSPRNLIEKLGALAEYPYLTILDCFTCGKGARSEVFLSFYHEGVSEWPCRVVRVDEPRDMNEVMHSLYEVHSALEGDVRFIFESLTGMQELWGGEDHIARFYAHSCPRLYELNTVAYWIVEKDAHSTRLRAQINQIAQVVIDLSIKRGKTSLAILKAEKRHLDHLEKPYKYWTRDLNISFEQEKGTSGRIDLGGRLREARARKGVSQSELAKLVGVTPSTISQIEGNLIYPSLPALLKMAEILSVETSFFFQESQRHARQIVFAARENDEIKAPDRPQKAVEAKALTPSDLDSQAEPYLIEISPRKKLSSHFFVHKGEEVGYLLSGRLQFTVDKVVYKLRAGDVVYLTSQTPSQWKNPGPSVAKLLWIKLK
jgi:transcriptional regulator with XRE-family HTH domain/KaiC/GvpD/RAD55 family RecA-like ATPase